MCVAIFKLSQNIWKFTIYYINSFQDDLIEYNDYVWGKPTSEIPTADGKKVYPSYTHMQTKGETAADQFNMVKNKAIPS